MNFFPFILSWPRCLNRDRMWSWNLAGTMVSGGRALSGAEPRARFDGGGLWEAKLTDVQVSSADHVRAWRALRSLLDGGATPVVMEARQERFTPWPLSYVTSNETTNSDGSSCSDDSPYEGSVISASVVSAAALRATSLTLHIDVGAALRGGEHFSIQHDVMSHRLYEIGQVTIVGGNSVVTIRPPLREAVIAGTRVEFDYPKCVMQLADPKAMDLALDRRFHGQASVLLRESFPPFNI